MNSSIREILAGLLAIIYMSGRWSIAKLEGVSGVVLPIDASVTKYDIVKYHWHLEVRLWLLVSLALFTVIAVYHTKKKVYRVPIVTKKCVCYIILLFVYLTITIYWSKDQVIGVIKGCELMYVASLIGLFVIIQQYVDIKPAFFRAFIFISSILALLSISSIYRGEISGRAAALGGGPNVFGRTMAILALVLLCYAITRKRKRIIYLISSCLALTLVIASGSRGVIISTVVTIPLLVILHNCTLQKKIAISIMLLTTLVITIGVAFEVTYTRELYQYRILQKTIDERYTSSRDVLATAAVEKWTSDPVLGTGLGSFGTFAPSGLVYPHNIILEILSECGLVGLVLLLCSITTFTTNIIRYPERKDIFSCLAFFLSLFASQFSGDLYDSRGVFIFMVMATFTQEHNTNNVDNGNDNKSLK